MSNTECAVCQRPLRGVRQQASERCPTHEDDGRAIRGLVWSKWSRIERKTPGYLGSQVSVGDFLRVCESCAADGNLAEVERIRALVRFVPVGERAEESPLPKESGALKSAVSFASSMLRKGGVYITASQIAARYYHVDVKDVRRLLSSHSGASQGGKKR